MHTVMIFITRRKPLQDPNAFFRRRLFYINLLKTTRERAVALKVPILLIGRRAHASQRAISKARLQKIRRIDRRSLRGARPENRVNLVDEKDEVFTFLKGRQKRLEARFEVTSVARTGEQGP